MTSTIFHSPERKPPLVSIVTATMNAATALPRTIDSLRRQKGGNFEWLVADGGSTDGTLELLREADTLADWKSEPDTGIYDAWNKACKRASGSWILFLGAGDELAADTVLETIAPTLLNAHPQFDLVYGKVQYVSEHNRELLEEVGCPWDELRNRWEIGRPALPPHPGTFHHPSALRRITFDPQYRIAGDSHLLLRLLREKTPLFVPIAVSCVPIGGVSMSLKSALSVRREIGRINRELDIAPPWAHRIRDDFELALKLAGSALPNPIRRFAADTYRWLMRKPKRWSVR